jgi:hypothetical protein
MPVSSRFCAEHAVDDPDGREVLHPGEAQRLQLVEEDVHDHERVGAVDAGEHGRVPDHRQHLVGHLLHDLVGVAVREQPGERAATGHPVAAGVVDHDEVDATGLLAFGRKAGAGAAADDRLALPGHLLEPREQRLAVVPAAGVARARGERIDGIAGHGFQCPWPR